MANTNKQHTKNGKKAAPTKKQGGWLAPAVLTGAAGLAVIAALFVLRGGGAAASAPQPPAASAAVSVGTPAAGGPTGAGEGLVIPISGITAQAAFYPVEVDGTKLEVLAVQAPDGTIRTAFNTCQVCYDSGQGYYKQEGDVLVCQNCGNRFGMGQVEVAAGGCNPVPIFPEEKTVSADYITISNDFLREAKAIFANWKTAY